MTISGKLCSLNVSEGVIVILAFCFLSFPKNMEQQIVPGADATESK